MLDHRGRGEAAIGAAQFLRHVLAQLRQTFDMGLVDNRVFPRHLRVPVVGPSVGLIDHDGLEHRARVVALVERQVLALVADAIGQMRVGPGELAAEPLAIGVNQKLVRIEAVAGFGIVGPVHAIAVELAGLRVGQVAVPDILGALRQRDAVDLVPPGLVEQAQFDLLGGAGEQREVGAATVPGGAKRMRRAGRDAAIRLQERDRRQQAVEGQGATPGFSGGHNGGDGACVPRASRLRNGRRRCCRAAPAARERHTNADSCGAPPA